jgi:hypothetical protein
MSEFLRRPSEQNGITSIFGPIGSVRKGKARAFNQENLGWGSKGLGLMPAGADEQTVDFMVNVEKYKELPGHVKAMFQKWRLR